MFLLWFLFCFLNKQQWLESLFVLGIIFVCDTTIKLQNSEQHVLMVMLIVLNHFILTGNNTCDGGCESNRNFGKNQPIKCHKETSKCFPRSFWSCFTTVLPHFPLCIVLLMNGAHQQHTPAHFSLHALVQLYFILPIFSE